MKEITPFVVIRRRDGQTVHWQWFDSEGIPSRELARIRTRREGELARRFPRSGYAVIVEHFSAADPAAVFFSIHPECLDGPVPAFTGERIDAWLRAFVALAAPATQPPGVGLGHAGVPPRLDVLSEAAARAAFQLARVPTPAPATGLRAWFARLGAIRLPRWTWREMKGGTR